MRRVWYLNFDADEELAGHQATSLRSRAMQAQLAGAVSALVGSDELLDTNADYAGEAMGFTFMPTPRAIAVLHERGLLAPPAPTFEVLKRANGRALSATLGVALPEATFASEEEVVLAALSKRSPSGVWLIKREFGFAGRGAKRCGDGALSDDVRSFVRNALKHGGLEITPWVHRLADLALHGFLHEDGSYVAGESTVQRCDKFGQWEQTVVATEHDVSAAELDAQRTALREAADALHRIGYFGPFGIDGFRYALTSESATTAHFCPRCEINARYTMGWAIGMGENRPDLSPQGLLATGTRRPQRA